MVLSLDMDGQVPIKSKRSSNWLTNKHKIWVKQEESNGLDNLDWIMNQCSTTMLDKVENLLRHSNFCMVSEEVIFYRLLDWFWKEK